MRFLLFLLLISMMIEYSMPVMAAEKAPDAMHKSIVEILNAQAEAWNRADLTEFMKCYWQSPLMSFTGGGEIVRSYDALKARYEQRYGKTKESLGTLRFDEIEVTALGPDHALCMGRWYVTRKGHPDLDGVFSLVWTRTLDGWRIVHDHSSTRPRK